MPLDGGAGALAHLCASFYVSNSFSLGRTCRQDEETSSHLPKGGSVRKLYLSHCDICDPDPLTTRYPRDCKTFRPSGNVLSFNAGNAVLYYDVLFENTGSIFP